jgi:hypothetical protein
VSVSTYVYTWHRLQRVVAFLADSTGVSLELQIRDLLICQACHRHTSHFMCLCAKCNKKYFEHNGKLGTSIYAFCWRGETCPYNGTLQTYEIQTYINLAKIFHEIKWIVTGGQQFLIFFSWFDSPRGSRPPHCRGFEITFRHTTVGRTPLDEWSARPKNLWQHTTLTRDRHPCLRRDSKPQSQKAISRRPTS